MRKLPIIAKEEIINLIKSGEKSNNVIIEKIKNKFGVGIDPTYVSKIRKEAWIHDLTFATKDVEKKIRKKLRIDANMLEIAEEFTELGKKWLKEWKDREFTPKQISMVMSAFHKLFHSYQESTGGIQKKESIVTAINALDKKAEEECKTSTK